MDVATAERKVSRQQQADETRYQKGLSNGDYDAGVIEMNSKTDSAKFSDAVMNLAPESRVHFAPMVIDSSTRQLRNPLLRDLFFETLDFDEYRSDLLRVIVEAAKNGQESAKKLIKDCADIFGASNN